MRDVSAIQQPRQRQRYLHSTANLFISQIFKEREEDLKRLSRPLECVCFRTSIWDETLYKVCTGSSPYLASPLPLGKEEHEEGEWLVATGLLVTGPF